MMEAENDGLPPLPRPMYDVADLAARRKQLQTQQSTVATRRQQAVCVRRAVKVYGPKNNQNVVLDGLNMTVPKGTIYGLLGASGCGKTTLLSCIVGRRRLNSGEIWVLGGRPGSRGSGVPGPRIGYMPQEVALYGEFSIKETMTYFGWVAGMTTSQIGDRTEFLVKLLQLPSSSRFVKNLSGGQQRRVSLAAALINTPELLILDEPTVGVDPVLRQGIWDHLVDITSGGKTTVIVTTHYIEETRQAHVIGLMRGGRFLAEESPDNLMARYGTETLEDVFLKLAVMQNAGKRRRSSIVQEVSTTIQIPPVTDPAALHLDEDEAGEISGEFGDNVSMGGRVSIVPEVPHASLPLPPEDEVPPFTCWDNFKVLKPNHMQALIWKNLLWMWRNVGAMCFIIGLPVVQVVIFCMSIGRDPTGLKLSISNHELNSSALGLYGNMGDNMAECPVIPGCNYTSLSCRYLKHLRDRSVDTVIYGSDEEALEAVRRGYAWGALIFGDNFTESLIERAEAGRDAPDWIIESAAIQVRLDMSNQQIGTLLYRDIQYAFMDFVELLYTDCGINPKVAKLPPLKMHTPIYGDKIPNFTDFAAPGIILTVIFFLAVALTSGAMLLERNEGMLERSLVTGITGTEILFSHVVTQFLVMCFQTLLVLICCFAVFSLTCRGAMGWVAVLTILTGLCGMCFGFVVSVSCENERSATYMAIGSFLPVVMLCGIIWPVEGMNWVLKYISYVLPLTKSTESLRSILQRGWSIQTPDVYQGFLMTLVWIIVFLTVSILVLKFKKG